MAITTRKTKGKPLTHDELDTNFTDLNTLSKSNKTKLDNLPVPIEAYTKTEIDNFLKDFLKDNGLSNNISFFLLQGLMNARLLAHFGNDVFKNLFTLGEGFVFNNVTYCFEGLFVRNMTTNEIYYINNSFYFSIGNNKFNLSSSNGKKYVIPNDNSSNKIEIISIV